MSVRYPVPQPTRPRIGGLAGLWNTPLTTEAAATHETTGALASAEASIAGIAVHQHATTGALAADASTIAGTAAHFTLHATTGALSAESAAIAGAAERSTAGTFSAVGALSAQDAAIAGTATHLTLHTSTGALAAADSTVSGTAAKLVIHTSTGALAASAASISGASLRSTPGSDVYIPTASRVELRAIAAGSSANVEVDFLSLVGDSGSLVSVTVACTVFSGTDANAASLPTGAATITRSRVVQTVAGGLPGVIYQLVFTGLDSGGTYRNLVGLLAILSP